ncbi:hypothetical protein [Trinickia mobilis]|uniref:hypothetical protein n=1 Tax=Trinickia mobilis TaxID=2816356 RepID=UPI001A8C9ED3|nr:hypothetical protein [Trinickia mobilis]
MTSFPSLESPSTPASHELDEAPRGLSLRAQRALQRVLAIRAMRERRAQSACSQAQAVLDRAREQAADAEHGLMLAREAVEQHRTVALFGCEGRVVERLALDGLRHRHARCGDAVDEAVRSLASCRAGAAAHDAQVDHCRRVLHAATRARMRLDAALERIARRAAS